jgi:hypothetical protein
VVEMRITFTLRHLVILLLFCLAWPVPGAVPEVSPEYRPFAGWRTSTPEEQGMRSDLLARMLDRIRQEGALIDSLTIIRNGYLVLETDRPTGALIEFLGQARD